jgi:TetR/AcrR family transcriptional regulator, regulator of cefoperazone and chloramphenicol sensitivity
MSSTQEHILKAAVELFSEKGFANTTTRDICKQADANVAAVNYHFKGKSGLGDAVVDLLFENVTELQQEFLTEQRINTTEEWKKAIYNFIYNFICDRDKEEYRNFYRSQLIFKELNTPSELFQKMFNKYMAPMQKQLIKYIKQGLPEDASEELISMWFITIMSQCVMFRKKQGPSMEIAKLDFTEPKNVKMVANHIADTVFAGLKFRGPCVSKSVLRSP